MDWIMNDLFKKNGLNQFLELVRQRLKYDQKDFNLFMNSDLGEMGLDSMAALNLMLDLEENFGVVFPESMFTEETFATPDSLWKSLLILLGK
jgi:acyl carrier protein